MTAAGPPSGRLRAALWIGAALWLALLAVGFTAPGGWTWGLTGPVGHIENFMIAAASFCGTNHSRRPVFRRRSGS